MCLTKRIEPCKVCVAFLKLSKTTDLIEDAMENNTITEGKYLKDMNEMKKGYDCFTKCHKTDGCSDCIIDGEPDDDSDDDNVVEVEPFFWRGNEYAIGDPMPSHAQARPLFNIVSPHDVMGHVTSAGAVTIY